MKQDRIVSDMETKLKRIAKLSCENPKMKFNGLMPHFNKENLISCFNELDRKKAVGVDGKTKDDYAKDLEENIEKLVAKMKTMSYRPAPVREVLIPKDNGKTRPLGISNIEDKIVQTMFSKILESIYEPLFFESSYGFRKDRSCHDAIKSLTGRLHKAQTEVVIDVDLENYFGTIEHKKLVALLELKIEDKRFIRYIVRMLKSGVLAEGELRMSDEGTPQGSICSPILSNIFAHYAIDQWFESSVLPRIDKGAFMIRYCDDLVIGCSKRDADRIVSALNGRMKRFSLVLNAEKTKVVDFNKHLSLTSKQGNFDFLGFSFYIGKSKNGFPTVKLKTSSKKFKSKLKNVKIWCKRNRHRGKLLAIWKIFVSKIRGHIRYYGVSHNSKYVQKFVFEAKMIFFKWINRRSQRKSLNWAEFDLFLKKHPLPKVKVFHPLF